MGQLACDKKFYTGFSRIDELNLKLLDLLKELSNSLFLDDANRESEIRDTARLTCRICS